MVWSSMSPMADRITHRLHRVMFDRHFLEYNLREGRGVFP